MLQVDYDLIYVWQALFPPGTKIISIKFFFFFKRRFLCATSSTVNITHKKSENLKQTKKKISPKSYICKCLILNSSDSIKR